MYRTKECKYIDLSRSVALKLFLDRKNITYKECSLRQKAILNSEEYYLWDSYTWNLKDK